MNIREQTKEIHELAEKTKFSQRMVNGEISNQDYLNYLVCQRKIFQTMETWNEFNIPHSALPRVEAIEQDIAELKERDPSCVENLLPNVVNEYHYYMLGCMEPEQFNSHVYVNYMGMLFGGSIVKKNAPTSGRLYNFENRTDCIAAIRELNLDVTQVKKAFLYHIEMLLELQEMSDAATRSN